VAARLRLNVLVVSNSSRPIRPPGISNVRLVLVGDSADAADDRIAEHTRPPTYASPPTSRWHHAVLREGRALSPPPGKQWTQANIGDALVGREIARHLREFGTNTRGPAPLTKRDGSRFLSALDTALQAAMRDAASAELISSATFWPLFEPATARSRRAPRCQFGDLNTRLLP
jgi:uncharacterized protein